MTTSRVFVQPLITKYLLSMRDFTLNTYRQLLSAFIDSGYKIDCFNNYLLDNSEGDKIVILRHDIDRNPNNALNMAKLENNIDINASYYFRILKESYSEEIIKEIAAMGHEIGYHYEDLSLCRGDYELAIKNFELNLRKLRKFYPVKTICMHGSPLSKWDNRLIWQKYNYRDFGIIGEPYFDIDFNEVLYLTDTGRRWNASSENIRDKVESKFDLRCKSTFDIIEKFKKNKLPNINMINIHPQRWTDSLGPWINELIWQNTKNVIKEFILAR